MKQRTFIETVWVPECTDVHHTWTCDDKTGPLPGDKCDCGEATWTDPEIPEDQAQAARNAPRLSGM